MALYLWCKLNVPVKLNPRLEWDYDNFYLSFLTFIAVCIDLAKKMIKSNLDSNLWFTKSKVKFTPALQTNDVLLSTVGASSASKALQTRSVQTALHIWQLIPHGIL